MTTAIDILHTNKRKFISDVEVYPPSARVFSTINQVEASCNPKRIKANENERVPASIPEIEETDHMMICEESDSKEVETMVKTPAVIIPKHCNGICDADASPTTFIIRCYCDPYRLNGLVPYHSDIY